MHSIHALIVDLTLITIYAGITTLLFKWLKQPTVLGYILAGIFAGPFFNFVPTVSDNENLTLWADIGVIFLLFGLGLEFSFKKMISVGKSAMITALLNIVLMLFAGFYTGKLLGWPVMDCFLSRKYDFNVFNHDYYQGVRRFERKKATLYRLGFRCFGG